MGPASFAAKRSFHTSITAIATAFLLVGSVQSIVIALQEPLRPAVIWLVNLAVQRGHLREFPFYDRGVIWPLVTWNLVNGAVLLCLSYGLGSWNYKKRGPVVGKS
jgi:hypothetical protein